MCGCGAKTSIAKYTAQRDHCIKGKPVRFLHGHGSRRSLPQRFWEKVDKGAPDDCWEWTGSTYPAGYGNINVGGKLNGAHRVAYELANGPIPKGEGYHGTCVLHRCDNPPCVNPAHLFLGNIRDNAIDMTSKGRQGHAKLSPNQIPEIRRLARLGNFHRDIAALFGVSRETISQVIRGERWGHVKD